MEKAMNKIFPVAVVGGGIAGYSAALTLKSLKTEFIWFAGNGYGDKLEKAEHIRNFPAFSGDGESFAAALEKQRRAEGVDRREIRIDGVYALGEKFLLTHGKEEFYARSVILATGVKSGGRLKDEEKFLGRGLSYCAVCDGALYRDKVIAVVCGAAEFIEEVEYLASFASRVHVFCRVDGAVFHARNIITETGVPIRLLGENRVQKLELRGGDTLDIDGVFVLDSATPPAALVGGLQADGVSVTVTRDLKTNIEGLFAAGDITGRPYQYVKAAGEGNVAAYSAVGYLKS